MKKLFTLLVLLSFSALGYAQDRLLLIPVDGSDEQGLIIENPQFDDASKEVFSQIIHDLEDQDIELGLQQEFSLNSYIQDHLTIEGQVTAFVMALGGRISVGHRFFNDHLEIGGDLGALLIMAGSGVVSPEAGVYIKARLNPQDSVTYYFKGRLYKAWGLASDITRTIDYGIGVEREGGAFFELTLKQFSRDGKSDLFMPFLSFGIRFMGPKSSRNDSYLFSQD
jgi:hypothetical protein